MSKKQSASRLIALCFCSAFSGVPILSGAQNGPQDLTLQKHYMTEPPSTILNARQIRRGWRQ